MKFSKIIGHEELKQHLISTIADGRVSHAQLYISDEGVGALPMSIAYAQRLLCESLDENGDSCGTCKSCFQMERLEHPDCHFIYPVNRSNKSSASSTQRPVSDHFASIWREFILKKGGYVTEKQWYQEIGIENRQGNISREEANELLRKMSFKSVQKGYKIAIIWLPERMHEAAANTLLKLIEEPAPQTLFLFVSEQPDKIISTIRSRTQPVIFSPLPAETIVKELIGRGIEYPQKIAEAADGSMTRALAMVEDETRALNFSRFQELMRKGFLMKYGELFEWAEEMATLGREEQRLFCEESISLLRTGYMISINMGTIAHVNPQEEAFLKNFSPFVNNLSLEPFIKEFELLSSHIKQNGNPKIIFPDFALKISKIVNLARKNIPAK